MWIGVAPKVAPSAMAVESDAFAGENAYRLVGAHPWGGVLEVLGEGKR